MKKKGLSPVIASVLMIMLVLILAAMIFLWARGFVTEQIQKFDKPIGDVCATVNFDAVRIGDSELEVINRGNVGIRHFEVRLTKGGNAETSKFDFGRPQIAAGEALVESVSLLMKDGSDPDSVVIYPALLGNVRGESANKVFTCTEAGKTI
jgi:flagellin-like protein